MKISQTLAAAVAVLGLTGMPLYSAEKDCVSLTLEVTNQIKADVSRALEVVQTQVGANGDCACEVVKAAIQATSADASLVARIVEVASTTAPDKMRIIAQCAVAVAPDSLPSVQAVLAKLDPNSGNKSDSAKGGKAGMEKAPITETAAIPNPLDFPGNGVIPSPPRNVQPNLPQPPTVVPPVTGA